MLNICHVNAGSVFPKIDLLRDLFENVSTHINILSETWMKSQHTNKAVELPGYTSLSVTIEKKCAVVVSLCT